MIRRMYIIQVYKILIRTFMIHGHTIEVYNTGVQDFN